MNNLLPIFMKLENSKCLVVGGGKIALQKIHQLINSDADVSVVAPDILEEIKILPVTLIKRKILIKDLEGFKIVIAATNNNKTNKSIYMKCSQIGIPVNVVDKPNLCSFYMGSVYQDGDLKIAISTNGKCPSLGTYLKDYIKNLSKGMWGKALNDLAIKREHIINTLSSYSMKKEVMAKVVKNKFNKKIVSKNNSGKVYLVGAGPGDPELITVKGLKAIQNADVIFHDALIHPYLAFEVNPIAKKIFVGKREDKHSVNQDIIHSLMIESALTGKKVVRLKGGDPFIFGRGGEETIALAKENIAFEIIPGVTAGIAAAAVFGIPLTHREDATSTIFLTGHQCQTAKRQDWKNLAKLNSTLVFYMGVRRLSEITMALINHGKSKNTPLAIIQNATLINQKIITSNLGSIIETTKNYQIITPAIIIIGSVVNNYKEIQNCIDALPENAISNIKYIDFNIWENKTVIA